MQDNVDIIFVILFLLLNLAVGIYAGKGVNTIREYAVGNKTFSTQAIAATIIATWMSGSFFTVVVSQAYKEGIWVIPLALGDVISLIIIGYVIAPKMKKFMYNLSVAETMGQLYGQKARLVTAIASIAQATAMLALQIKVFSTVFTHFLGVSSTYAVCLSSFTVIVYSAWGGIKAVTLTDIIQFFTFGTFIPLFAMFIWQAFNSVDSISHAFNHDPLFDYTQLINYQHPKFFPNFGMFLWFLIPSLNAPTFQRTLMARNTEQIRNAFSQAAIAYSFIVFFICFIGLVVLAHDKTLDPNNIVMHIVDKYAFAGLKAITLIGIIAMVMSTADSWLNTGAVIFAHDLCGLLGLHFKNELLISRIFTVIIGIISVLLVLSSSSLFKLFSLQANFYMPIVTMPLMLGILGLRSTPKIILAGMCTGAISAMLWSLYITPITEVDSVVPSMFCNFVTIVLLHGFYCDKPLWVPGKINLKKLSLKDRVKNAISSISQFSLIQYCQARIPKTEITYYYFAFGALLTVITTFFLDHNSYPKHSYYVHTLQGIALFTSTTFICRNLLWSENLKAKYTGIIWYTSIFISLSFISSALVLISKFSEVSLVIFLLNICTIGMLMNWQTTLLMMIGGVLLSFPLHEFYFGEIVASEKYDFKLKIIYAIFMVSSFILAFLKPKQEREIILTERDTHLTNRLLLQEKQVKDALSLKSEFIRNMQHEYHTPMTGIMAMSQMLYDSYHNLSDEERINAAEVIYKSFVRLESFDSNLASLAKLSKPKFKLERENIDFSEILEDRIKTCRKLYEESGSKREFLTNLPPEEVIIQGDKYYLQQMLDNIIINAITYCEHGLIEITLEKLDPRFLRLYIRDSGIGIPPSELLEIFGEFMVSSKTRTPSGGRGIGLALCKKIVTAHQGSILAESDGESWTLFTVTLPLS